MSNGQTDARLQQLRNKQYPAYVNKMAEIMKVPPYRLMPLWETVSREVDAAQEEQSVSHLTVYIKTCKAFRELLITNNLVSARAVEKYIDAHLKTTSES